MAAGLDQVSAINISSKAHLYHCNRDQDILDRVQNAAAALANSVLTIPVSLSALDGRGSSESVCLRFRRGSTILLENCRNSLSTDSLKTLQQLAIVLQILEQAFIVDYWLIATIAKRL